MTYLTPALQGSCRAAMQTSGHQPPAAIGSLTYQDDSDEEPSGLGKLEAFLHAPSHSGDAELSRASSQSDFALEMDDAGQLPLWWGHLYRADKKGMSTPLPSAGAGLTANPCCLAVQQPAAQTSALLAPAALRQPARGMVQHQGGPAVLPLS